MQANQHTIDQNRNTVERFLTGTHSLNMNEMRPLCEIGAIPAMAA